MKHALALAAGLTAGALLFVSLVYFNPFSAPSRVSPLAVTDRPLLTFSYSAVPDEAVFFTNDGTSVSTPQPPGAATLWEPTLRDSRVLITDLVDSRGQLAGIGIKFTTNSEDSRILNAEMFVDSAWHLYLPARGTLFVDQRENHWTYLRDIVAGAHLNSADNWRGRWSGLVTTGPNPIGTARVAGGSGEFASIDTEAVESLKASAYSADRGPVAMDGNLVIALTPDRAARASGPD